MSVVRLTTQLADVDATLALYDRIQYWRSTNGQGGTYVEITSESGSAAVLVGTALSPFTINGLVLNISLNGADPIAITFSGTDPIRIEDIVTAINAAMPTSIASPWVTDTRRLQLLNPMIGTQSSILVSGTAAAALGLSTQQVSGTAPRTLMGNLVSTYRFADYAGDPTYWYKSRFSSSLTGAVSAFSTPQQGGPTQVLANASLVLATVNMTDVTGAPVVGKRVIIVPVAMQQISNGGINYGLLPSRDRIELTTDESGHAETELVIGSTVRVFFEGSGLARECVIPAATPPATSIDLLAIISTQPDPFSIVQAPPMPIRES